jgi:hypothetical protein
MKYTLTDKIIAYVTLLGGLTISAVAIYYSVAGLVAIFAAAAVPIIIMGVVLETSKLIATVWLKWNWHRAPFFIKTYLLIAIITLMLITSMGIFGFLSKAHIDQVVPAGDTIAKVGIIDEKIKIQQDIIEQYRKDLTVLNTQIDRYNELGAVSKGVAVRKQQQAERTDILSQIEQSQQQVTVLREERFPLASQVRSIEAEVGPIKYIAALIYDENPTIDLLERAVRWVIIVIVAVFDPLAVILLLSSQYSFQWFREAKQKDQLDTAVKIEPPLTEPVIAVKIEPTIFSEVIPRDDTDVALVTETTVVDEQDRIDTDEMDDAHIISQAPDSEKSAMKAWKNDNPKGSLKIQRRLFANGLISALPWSQYMLSDNDAVVEATKWAQEQIDNSANSYKQNSEQSDSTLWQRLKGNKNE